MDVGIGLVVDESGTKDHGAEESVEHQGLPVLLNALGTRGQRLVVGLHVRSEAWLGILNFDRSEGAIVNDLRAARVCRWELVAWFPVGGRYCTLWVHS